VRRGKSGKRREVRRSLPARGTRTNVSAVSEAGMIVG
jgi:hypothetical protein